MIRHIVIAALRNMAANRLISAIAIMGLGVGIAVSLLAALVARNQLSFDHFIPGYERTYVAVSLLRGPGADPYNLKSNHAAAALLALNAPGIESVTRLMLAPAAPGDGDVTLKQGTVSGHETIYWAQPDLAAVLPLPVFRGDLHAALAQPDGIALPRAIARKYFGHDEAVGEKIWLNGHPMTVRAVIEDLPQGQTELESGIFASSLASFSGFPGNTVEGQGFGIDVRTYLRLKPGASIAGAERYLPALAEQLTAGLRAMGVRIPYSMSLVRIDRVNLHDGLYPGARMRLAVEVAVAVLILFISAVNFVNLLTARTGRRVREVGVRKACGAGRGGLMAQFLGEAVLTVAFSACLGLALAEWLLPYVNAFLDAAARFDYWRNPSLLLTLTLGTGALGLVVGAYPALLLSALRPARTLKERAFQADGGGPVRNLLTGAQFAILVVLIVAAIVVWQQRDYALRDGLKVRVSRMLMLRGPCTPALRTELRKLAGVAGIGCSNQAFLDGRAMTIANYRGATVYLNAVGADRGIFALYGIKPLAGTLATANPEGDFEGEPPRGIILNALAARRLGFASPQAAVDQGVPNPGGGNRAVPTRILAVVPDFAFYSVERRLEPTLYEPGPGRAPHFDLVSIKLNGQAIPETLAAIDRVWSRVGNTRPIDRFFLDAYMQALYAGMVRQAQLLGLFAGMAILLACLGLFGIAVATAERRTKEIGVRKAMGAGNGQIVVLLLWQFAQPVLWANVIAWPLAWWLMRRWLAGFAYHVDLHWWMFAGASLGALAIALLTVAGQAFLTARAKPVLALRYE
jgi:putative ABC transport system permease protein